MNTVVIVKILWKCKVPLDWCECVSEKSNLKKNLSNLMNFIPKLFVKTNLPNIFLCKNEFIFFYI